MVAKILENNGTGKLTIQCEEQKKFKTEWLEIKQIKEQTEGWKTFSKLRVLWNILIDYFVEINHNQWPRYQVEEEFKIIGKCYEMMERPLGFELSIYMAKYHIYTISWSDESFENGIMTLEKASKIYELVMEFLRNSYPKLYTEFMLRYIKIKQNRG
jgi:hypothetical protein